MSTYSETLVEHESVLFQEVLGYLALGGRVESGKPRYLLDCTLGGGGHALGWLKSGENAFLVGIDRDLEAMKRAKARLKDFESRTALIRGNFADAKTLIGKNLNLMPAGFSALGETMNSFDAILVDLGVSSYQLAEAERGFSFQKDGPLDMRMDQESTITADKIVNAYSLGELKALFQQGGVGQYSGKLARAIIEARPVKSTLELRHLCEEVLGSPRIRRIRNAATGSRQSHPATVPFQALRIAVNDELNAIRSFLADALELLRPGGRLCVISFHSLEDKVVTQEMRKWKRSEGNPKLPSLEGLEPRGLLLTPSAVVATEAEVCRNPRARSARMRVFEKSVSIGGSL